jgi:hypothetical protein|tara:strand:+ start:155 stop:367 length:213 start_codon:yes stop_codon:yes gene_type:complete
MSANGISTLSSKELKQVAKLDLAAIDRAADGNARSTYDINLLPTKYSGNTVVNNDHGDPVTLDQGRPWTE